MAVYDNLRKESPINAVEFTPVSDGNFAFFHVDSPVKKQAVKDWLKSNGQEIMAESNIEGHPVLVTHGDKTQEELVKLLEAQGDKFALHEKEKKFDFWKARSTMSVIGQSLQMISSAARLTKNEKSGAWEHKGIDGSIMTFAVLNMTANVMGFVFGSQKTEDDHHLSYLKDQFNHKLDSHVLDGSALPDTEDKRNKLHLEPAQPKGIGEKTWDFLQRNSVTVGEIGLRFVGAAALVFPMNKGTKLKDTFRGWQTIGQDLMKGEGLNAFKKGLNKNALVRNAGIGYLVGKTIALFSKVKDPYDPKPHTTLDTIREDFIFKAGSLIEAAAGSTIAYNAFTENKIGFGADPKPMTDWAGAIGGVLFATGYLLRLGAKFGEKKMNMEELHAHISDSLAKVPPNELPQLIAECSASVVEHFKDKNLDYGKVYTQIMTDMYRYHHIALDNLGTEPEERLAKMNGNGKHHAPATDVAAAPAEKTEGSHASKHTRKSASDLASIAPATSHVEKAAQAAEAHHGLSA